MLKITMDLIDGLIETNDIDSIEEKINKICYQWHVTVQ